MTSGKPFSKQLKDFTKETLAELCEQDAASKRVYEAFDKFRKDVSVWMNVSERVFYDQIM